MSELRVDDILDKEGLSAPGFSKGAVVTGVCTATTFVGALTGNVTATTLSGTLTGTASGLAGSPDITVGTVSGTNLTNTKQLTSEHANITGVSTVGILTATTSAVVGSAVTSNDSGIVDAGIITAGTCFKTGNGVFGAGIGATITGAGDAVFAGVTTAATLNATASTLTNTTVSKQLTTEHVNVSGIGTFAGLTLNNGFLQENWANAASAWSTNGTVNLDNGMVHYNSNNLAGTTNTIDLITTAGIATDLANGSMIAVTLITAVSATTAYINNITIDGVAQTESWIGGSAPSDGGGSGFDTYTFNILRWGTGTTDYTIIANHGKTS